MPEALGERGQVTCGAAVRPGTERQVRERIPGDAVGAALQNDELGRVVLEVAQDLRPGHLECRIVGTRCQGQVEFGAGRRTAPAFVGATRARIEEPAILVQVGENHLRVALEPVKDAITVMRIDIHIRHSRETRLASQPLDGNRTIVERTKPGRTGTPRVVQARDGHEGPPRATLQHLLAGKQGCTDHIGRRLVDTAKGRRVAAIKIAGAGG